jgi:acetyl esterase/lipase
MALVFLHGSGWHYADKDFGTRHFFKHLSRQGHVIVDVAYSLAPSTDLFGMMDDVKGAIIWTKEHAQELTILEDRVVLMGGSAGGHLALLAAYTSGDSRFDPTALRKSTSVCGVVSYYGPTDLQAQYDRLDELPKLEGGKPFERMFMRYLENRTGFKPIPVHQLLPNLLGGIPSDVLERYGNGSPITHVSSSCPPTLLLQGMHDFTGVAPQAVQLHESLLRAGATSFLFLLPDTEHGFDLYKPKWSPAAQSATYVTERFLASLV